MPLPCAGPVVAAQLQFAFAEGLSIDEAVKLTGKGSRTVGKWFGILGQSSAATPDTTADKRKCKWDAPVAPEDCQETNVTAKAWHRPVQFDLLGARMGEIWGYKPREVTLMTGVYYTLLREAMELHRCSADSASPFDLSAVTVFGSVDQSSFISFVTAENVSKSYTHDK